MLNINMADVIDVLESIQSYLIVIGVAVVLGIIIMIAVKGMKDKAKKFVVRSETGIAVILVIAIAVNLICTGPMSTLLDLASGSGTVSDETAEEANALVNEISQEGIVLLENDDNVLPLSSAKINVFGWACTSPIYGGTGSGALNDAYHTVDLLEGLTNAGIEYNTELTEFYQNYATARGAGSMFSQDWTLPEPNVSQYTDEMISNAKEFSDTAVVVIARSGGEGYDLPTDMTAVVNGTYMSDNMDLTANDLDNGDYSAYYNASYDDTLNEGTDWDEGDHYLQLDNREEELIEMVCSNFDNVIVVYNGSNAMELGFVEDYEQIKGVLWAAGPGQTGFNALGEILAGEINPSGRMVDTYLYDLTQAPTWNNGVNANFFTNMSEYTLTDNVWISNATPSFTNYVEGIYVGYRFYETAAAEGLINYDEVVQYPFGYGLSYTTFTQEITSQSVTDGAVTVDVTVTNTGDVAGKEVVQLYYNPPYINGGVEKASANLAAYGKTALLEPGTSETVTLTFDVEDMASYDDTNGYYIMDAGDYIISLNSDSHNIIDSFTYTVDSTIIYDESNPRSSDQVAATNQFDYATDNGFTYLSRADGFANYAEATAAPTNFEMSEELKAGFYVNSTYLTAEATAEDEDADAEYPTTGASNGLTMTDMRGLSYDDPQWDTFLDQLSLSDMNTLISLGGYQTPAVDSIGKIRSNDCDGPAAINNNFSGEGSVGFTACVMVAASFNQDLAKAYGESIGKMANEMDTSGWYAPATNIHRTAFGGRNFEYYSEDPVLSGTTASKELEGAYEYGVYGYLKHFAMNDSEANRCSMVCIFASEQSMREIYLKCFEIPVKDGNCRAIMSSFSYIGNRWAGGNSELCQTVLRDEWGFQGMVLTDYFGGYGYMSADEAMRNGTDFCLTNHDITVNNVQFQETAGSQQAMRQACKNILYVTANSRSYSDENLNPSMATWKVIMIAADVVVAALLIVWEIGVLKGYKKRKNQSAVE